MPGYKAGPGKKVLELMLSYPKKPIPRYMKGKCPGKAESITSPLAPLHPSFQLPSPQEWLHVQLKCYPATKILPTSPSSFPCTSELFLPLSKPSLTSLCSSFTIIWKGRVPILYVFEYAMCTYHCPGTQHTLNE